MQFPHLYTKNIPMLIQNCTPGDLPDILELYQHARNLQQERNVVVWPPFSEEFLLKEIGENRQWKLVDDNGIACNWAITFEDPEIWGEKDKNDSIFIHRLCIDASFRGNRCVDTVVNWAKDYAVQQNRQYVRLDTLGNNTGLIRHYTSAGFDFLGIFRLTETANLPGHYQQEPDCCLFEIKV
jgi:ribosomal protein S18 acetylase RimI-like enzyme